MENKFYVPSQEEFCIGFEYEMFLDSAEIGFQWIKSIFGMNILSLKDIEELLERHKIRVKYLDEQDIIECGFSASDDHYYMFTEDDNGREIDLFLSVNGTHVRIFSQYGPYDYDFFNGTIKNKHELKRILKMVL